MGEEGKVALIAGASGLVGGKLLDALLGAPDFQRIYAVTRRPLGREHARLANRIIQFERLESQLKGLACHTAFCCLGSPSGGGGSDQETRQIEYGYALSFARAARAAQAQRFVLLSCARADASARSAALLAKSEVENAVAALGFDAVDILRPGPLLGLRRQMRAGDLVRLLTMPLINPFLGGAREPYRGISARVVAQAMLGASRSGRRGCNRYTNATIAALSSTRQPRGAAAGPARAPKAGPPSR